MNRECPRCNSSMEEAVLDASPSHIFRVRVKKAGIKGLFTNSADVTPYVCPICGYIELIAYNPSIFKKD